MATKRKKFSRLRASEYALGDRIALTISYVNNQRLDDKSKAVLFDANAGVCFICNGIHEMILRRMFGEDREDWAGNTIDIICQEVFYNRHKTKGFRILEY